MKLRKELNILKGQVGKELTLTRRTEADTQIPDFALDSPPRKEDKRKKKDKGKDTSVRKKGSHLEITSLDKRDKEK